MYLLALNDDKHTNIAPIRRSLGHLSIEMPLVYVNKNRHVMHDQLVKNSEAFNHFRTLKNVKFRRLFSRKLL